MNDHLRLVRDFHQKYGISQPEYPETAHLSDSEIILRQSLLLQCGSDICKAISGGDLEKILAGLVDLAYNALAAIALRGDDVINVTVSWRQDGSVLSMVKTLTDRMNNCNSGETVDYSGLYALCRHLCKFFLNADFDNAFQLVHDSLIAQQALHAGSETLDKAPDLSTAFYE
ncbi:MAG: nucleoside triphosphate pyrophosphohydrolase family protein [Methylococcales bacterium]|nr:nucleoside triphosphate pyrophosphohydrolase family protein [Methylococcales bacterium]